MLEQRDIVLIPVPYTDLSSTKSRPVLVVSSTVWNRTSRDILVVAITSNLIVSANGAIINTIDMERGSLPRQSLVRANKIYTLSQASVIKIYGKLNTVKFEEVLQQLDTVLGR